MEDSTLKSLFMADPTFRQTVRGSFTGRYGVWIGRMYVNGSIKLGDIPELKAALVTYNKNKSQLPPIKDCKSLSELIEWVKDLSDDFKPVRTQSKAKADLEKVYEDNEWVVYVPHSHEAARRGGEGTHWCTASENGHYYNMYSNYGQLYINVRKADRAKFQFHFETGQFMDADDQPAKLRDIGLSEGVINFYSKINPAFKFKLKFDWAAEFNEGFVAVRLNTECNFINTEGRVLSQQWFDWVCDFEEGAAKVKLNDKWNFINTEGQILSKQWFDSIWYFEEGVAKVKLNGKWNFINHKGQLLSEQWFDWTWDFNEGLAAVRLNGKYNFINTEGQLVSKQWFDDMNSSFSNGFARVKLNGKWNFINTEGKLWSAQWFDDAGEFPQGLCRG